MADSTQVAELSKTYDPAATQTEVAAVWEEEQCFHAEPDPSREQFVVVIPPPNVTAALHLGHALNNTVQDVLVRRARMQGKTAVWLPGTDHAGIATQSVVEKRVMMEEGRRRTDFGREEFVAKIRAWKDEYEEKILGQLKAMGCSCDFARTAFTMDEQRAKAVREAFFRLFKDGLIYRGKRLVNWDPATQTALADDEVEMEEVAGSFWYLKYPLVEEGTEGLRDQGTEGAEQESGPSSLSPSVPQSLPPTITVATTRPETMLGDTAVAVNPNDPLRAKYIGQKVKLPIVGREIEIIGDDYVVIPDPESSDPKAKYASGFLKVTPAHDPNDWDIGQRHDLEVINIMAEDATISDRHGWTPESDEAKQFVGLTREAAREQIVRWFEQHGLLEKTLPYTHAVGHSYRSHVPIEPYLSDQWYVAMQKPIPGLPNEGEVDGIKKNTLAGLALTALAHTQQPSTQSRARKEADPAQPGSTQATPTHFITFTTRGTRLHGDPRGSVNPDYNRFGEPWHPVNPDLVTQELKSMTGESVKLDQPRRQVVHDAVLEVCRHRGWTLHALHVRTNHLHVILDADAEPERVMNDFKSYATRRLREAGLAAPDAKVWTRHGSTRRLWHDKALPAAIAYVADGQGVALSPAPFVAEKRPAAPAPLPNGRGSVLASAESSERHGRLRFVPPRYAKTYHQWHANLRDWCISRQLWWGHRIPVWSGIVADDAGGSAEPTEAIDRLRLDHKSFFGESADVRIDRNDIQSWINIVPNSEDGQQRIGRVNELHHDQVKDIGDVPHSVATAYCSPLTQDPDVLDTWFSSALWPLSTLGWPDETSEVKTWNPTTVLCTAREIITLWVGRMVMFNRYLRGGDLPFKDVFIHAMIQDGHGQKMSKSLGNGVDPLDIINRHGADAMRFTLCQMTTHTQDVRMPVDLVDPHTGETFEPQTIVNKSGHTVAAPIQEYKGNKCVSSYGLISGEATPTDEMPLARNSSAKFDLGRNFCNKLWNAARFVLATLETERQRDEETKRPKADTSSLDHSVSSSLPSRWILSRLARTIEIADEALDAYRFDRYATALYDFVWRDYCDWYIEAAKPALRDDADPARREATARVLAACLDAALRLLSPVTPYLSERLWWALNDARPAAARDLPGLAAGRHARCMMAEWPTATALADDAAEASMARVQEIVTAVRTLRNESRADPRKKLPLVIRPAPDAADDVAQAAELIELWTSCSLTINGDTPTDAAKTTAAGTEILVGNLVDPAAGEKRRAELQKKVKALTGRLANKGYTDKAPPHLVQETRDELAAAEAELERL
jgi:valyl-tRNA synthetase